MARPKFVNSKVALARELGLSRNWITELFKLPDHPPARSNGQHNVSAWRKFVVDRAAKIKGVGTEKEKLQIDLLRCRLDRETLELSELDNTIRERATQEATTACLRVLDCLMYQLRGLPNQLAPRLSDKPPMEIFKSLRDAISARFRAAHDALEKIKHESRRKTRNKKEAENIIRFDRARAATGGAQ